MDKRCNNIITPFIFYWMSSIPHFKMKETDRMVKETSAQMKEKNITNLFVVDDDKRYCGVIHIHDIIKEGIK